jgi:geranylgeranyl pyrophosphate synthase
MHSNANEATIAALGEYGRCLGMAFQIADDVLDLLGEEKNAGKTLGTDLGQLKLTLPLIRLLDQLPSEQADQLRATISDNPTQSTTDSIRRQIRESGALDSAQQLAGEFAARAREALLVLPPSIYRSTLETLTSWAIQRDA